ncbi:unnamed protein product [Phytophthora fragariaefolia]|uniref:Unnamed protein product n=1 Tax=Phytophthora fragariaefolia TaxID=1490495 RepID=A0A9W7CJ80_9STRA|nr:unnamed protein product [Phytophthora fragariaefolia]
MHPQRNPRPKSTLACESRLKELKIDNSNLIGAASRIIPAAAQVPTARQTVKDSTPARLPRSPEERSSPPTDAPGEDQHFTEDRSTPSVSR